MPDTNDLRYWIPLAFIVLVVASFLIRRAGQRLREELKPLSAPAGPLLTKAQVDAIRAHGLATPEDLFKMGPKEQQMLAAMAVAMQGTGRSLGKDCGTRS